MRFKGFIPLYLILFLLVILICRCAVTPPSPCIRHGKDYSRVDKTVHYDWDSCYRRGCSYMKGDCPDLAISEFKMAIAEKPNDEKMTRSYGMHFLGYFPHRELGIAYYMIGRTEEAIRELEKSIEDSPSSKAKFFLNEARRAWLKENDLDRAPPWLDITKPSSTPFFTNKLKFTIEGQAADDRFVSALTIDGEPVFIELSGETIPFAQAVFLKPGLNEITLRARDLLDKGTEKGLQIVVDTTGPLINLSHSPLWQAHREGRIGILGVVYDESGVELLSIDDRSVVFNPIEIEKGEYAEAFYLIIDISKDKKMVSLLAKDRAGNVTEASIELSPITVSRRRMLGLQPNYENALKEASPFDNQDGIRMASLDTSDTSIHPFFAGIEDKGSSGGAYYEEDAGLSEDILYIDEKRIPGITVHDEIYLMGSIKYKIPASEIQILLNKELIISKKPRLPLSGRIKGIIIQRLREIGAINEMVTELIRAEENNLVFGEVIRLEPGQNEITFNVMNEMGMPVSRTFYVFKKKEDILEKKYRLCLSVLPVEDLSEPEWRSPFTERYVFRRLDSAFVEQGRFQVVERERLEEILIEHDITRSDLAHKKQIIQTGRLLRAEIIFSSFMRLARDSIELNGTLIDIETSKRLFPEDIYLEERYFKDKEEMLHRAVKILAMKIRDNFPLCKGKILKKKGDRIIVNIGKDQNIGDYTKLIVYRGDEFGAIFLSEARVKGVIDEICSSAVLLDKKRLEEIRAGDLVITK